MRRSFLHSQAVSGDELGKEEVLPVRVIATDVIAGSMGADALSVSENKGPLFPTLTVGNAEMDSADWVFDHADSTTAHREV
jgi:hypothetical protein